MKISEVCGKKVGTVKNCFDIVNVVLTCIIGLIFAHKIIDIGIGTLIAVLGVGRVIAIFQHLFYEKMEAVRI